MLFDIAIYILPIPILWRLRRKGTGTLNEHSMTSDSTKKTANRLDWRVWPGIDVSVHPG